MIIYVFFVITGIAAAGVFYLTPNLFLATAVWVSLFGSFIVQGLRRIPAQPPHKGILTIWGERQEVVKDEGWHFFPIYPFWHGVVTINVTKVNQDLREQLIRTPDRAELGIPVSLTWMPDKENPQNLIMFLNSGGESGVKSIIEDIVRERLRTWGFSLDEGPQKWQEAMGAQEDAAAILLKTIVGSELPPIPISAQTIPTPILLKYFNVPRRRPNESEARVFGENWESVSRVLDALPPEEFETVRRAVEERRTAIAQARQGNSFFPLPQLGIILNRLNIGEITPKGELSRAAELEAKEEQERKGEVFEVETDIIKAQKLMEAVKGANEQLSLQQAFQTIMEWKATREGRGFTVPGISPAIMEVGKTFLGERK